MPMYAFKGVGPGGKTSGLREAESPKVLRQLLRKDGIVVTDCEVSTKGGARGRAQAAAGQKVAKGLGRDVDLGGLFGGVKKTEIAAFTRQMATLLRSGIPLAETLGALFDQVSNIRFKVPVGEVRTAVNEGSSLADAMGKHPKLFDELYVSMVRAGEVAGNLDEVLVRLADFLDNAQKLRSKVQGAMFYPIIMGVVGAGIMGVLMVAVVPEITRMFSQQGKTLPINTRMLIGFTSFIGSYALWLVIALALGIYGFIRWSTSDTGRPVWHATVLRLPVIGDLARHINVARFARTLGTMLRSGVPMLRSLETGKMIMGNVVLRQAVEEAKKAVTEGESLAVTLKRSGQFPSTMIHMVAVGERAGQLEQMLERIADAYESEVDIKLTRLTSLLEPLMLVIMGGAVAFIVFSILQPIMDMGKFTGPR
ncbi:MAG: type II secretion system inner membrane protein GspF [Kofleriaceae bacterium]|jgi:general secretion pathway protein F|nr:type II secretion system inner membrane protein GspF [Kofleriaceae bacterium]MBP6836117.1 type II secretion system inner membrane protein GspF [Kofleriaceae bacterium]MBP9203188.1 type II secretion system inner membrane protein GspF [Kofleriaceae bacterium]